MNVEYVNALAKEIFNQNKEKGWWDDMNRPIFQTLQLVSTEIAEATEGERKNLMDTHLPYRIMGEVELADAAIRLLDLAGRYNWTIITHEEEYTLYNSETIAEKHFCCNIALARLGMTCYAFGTAKGSYQYSVLLNTIDKIAEDCGYDLWKALEEKLEYNKHRKDHTREARAQENGKSF